MDFNVSDFRTRLVYKAHRRLDALVTDEALLDCAVRTKVAIGRSHRELLGVQQRFGQSGYETPTDLDRQRP